MRRFRLALVTMLVLAAGMLPARSLPGIITFAFCNGDGNMQIFGWTPQDDVWLQADIGCSQNGGPSTVPMHIETIIGASTVGAAGGCGEDGVEGPLKFLRLRTTMTIQYAGQKHTALRTWTGNSTGTFPGSWIVGKVRDPSGTVALGDFRLEFFPGWYCAYGGVYVRLWNLQIGPSPGL